MASGKIRDDLGLCAQHWCAIVCITGMERVMATKAPKRCKYCDQGIELKRGQHWIVQSIIPARIKIVTCKAPAAKDIAK